DGVRGAGGGGVCGGNGGGVWGRGGTAGEGPLPEGGRGSCVRGSARGAGCRTRGHLRAGRRSRGARVSGYDAHPTVVACAPGKIFRTGEYAVLGGAPALVAAVDRVAEVRIAPQGGPGPLVITSLAEDERWVVDGEDRGE